MLGGTTISAAESRELTQPRLQLKRHASLPTLNLVTAQQVEVDLLVDLPSSFYPEHAREDIPDSPSHPPWPHSPSASSLVTPLSATGLYIVLDEASDSGLDVSGRIEVDNDAVWILNDHPSHLNSHLDHDHITHPTLAKTKCRARLATSPSSDSLFELVLTRRKPDSCLSPLDSVTLFPLDDLSGPGLDDPLGLTYEEEQAEYWDLSVSLGDSTCRSWSCLQLPLAPETPPEAFFPPHASPEAYLVQRPVAIGQPPASPSTELCDESRSTELFSPLDALSIANLACTTDNSSSHHGSDKPSQSRFGGAVGVRGLRAEFCQAQTSRNLHEECRQRVTVTPTLPTLILHTSSSTSLLLADTPNSDNRHRNSYPADIVGDHRFRPVCTRLNSPSSVLASNPIHASSIPSINARNDLDDHILTPRTAVFHPPGTSRFTAPLPFTRSNRRSATVPVEVESATMRRNDKSASTHMTSIDTLFAQPKHGLGATLGPLLGFAGLRRSLSAGGHGGSKGRPVRAGVGKSRPRNPTPQGSASRGSEHSMTSTTTSARSSFSIDSLRSQGPQGKQNAEEPGSATGAHGMRAVSHGGKQPAPVSPTSTHGPHHHSGHDFAYPTSPHRSRFGSNGMRYRYLPSSSREACPTAPCVPHQYDCRLVASESASSPSMLISASSSCHVSLSRHGCDRPLTSEPVCGVVEPRPSTLRNEGQVIPGRDTHVTSGVHNGNEAQLKEGDREGCQENAGATGGYANRSVQLGALGELGDLEHVGLGVVFGSSWGSIAFQGQPSDARSHADDTIHSPGLSAEPHSQQFEPNGVELPRRGDRVQASLISDRWTSPKDDNSPTLEPVADSNHYHTRSQPLLSLPLHYLETPTIAVSSSYHSNPSNTSHTTATTDIEDGNSDSRPSKHSKTSQDSGSKAPAAFGPLTLALPSETPCQSESTSSQHDMERELWNIQFKKTPKTPKAPKPPLLPSPSSSSQALPRDGSPLSPSTTSSGSLHDTKSIKEKKQKKGGWFRKNKDDEEPNKTEEKPKKKKAPYGGGGGYLDSLMLPPGQPLNQPVYVPGGGRVAVKQPKRRNASSVEPLSPTWSQSQPDSDRSRSLRQASVSRDDNHGHVVEIPARSSPSTPQHIPLPPLTPQSSSGHSASHYFNNSYRPSLPTQTPQTPNSLSLSLSPRSSTLRLDPVPNQFQHQSDVSGSVANKELRDSRRHSQYTLSSISGSEYAQSLPSATMQRGASGGLYPLGERPSVSTVYEEYQPIDHADGGLQQSDRRPSTIESDDGWARDSRNGHHRTGERPSALQLNHTAFHSRRQYPPSALPPTSISPRTQRSSTISSSSNSIHSKPKTPGSHPFASGQEPSPNQQPERVSPPSAALPGIPTHSFPSFSDSYRMQTSIAPAHQVALASPEDEQGDPDCPVCCESMSFTFRLPGEKPHVVPECGHALHEECFVTVYGPVPSEGSQKNIGVCGVCRQPMRVNGSDRSSGKNKLATLMGGSDTASLAYEIVDPQSDDPLEPAPSPSSSVSGRNQEALPLQVVVPRIEVRPEYQSVRRSRAGKQTVTALVVVEVPPAADRSKYPARQRKASSVDSHANVPPSPTGSGMFREQVMAGIQLQKTPFANVLADLKRRLVSYKYSGLDSVGALCLFDILKVRKSSNVQDFHLYLFQDALICVSEERKSGISGGIFKKNSPDSPNESILRMRGRIFLRDVHLVTDSSTANELSIALTLETQEHGVDSIVICFGDRNSHEMWRSTIRRLIDDAQISANANAKAEKLLNQRPPSRAQSISSSGGRGNIQASSMNLFQETLETCTPSCPLPCPGALVFNAPIAPHHTPIDIVIAIATPALAPGATLPLKTRLMRSALHFVLATMGPRDRISLVAAELGGANAIVRRTPLLNATRHDSRKRLEQFVEGIGGNHADRDEFEIETQEDKPDVVTSINVALDVILQRKTKNPLSGLVLVSDASDLIKRQQMDLVTARLDAAKLPVHCFGYGKSHDPSPLWMISNHTHGTYTFVREWYHLRDALAGVMGGLMSIALTKVGLRLACQDDEFKVVKVSGASQAVISSSGRDIDIDLNILRHGEVRQILVDFEFEGDNVPPGTPFGSSSPIDSSGEEGPIRSASRQHSIGSAGHGRMNRGDSVSNGVPPFLGNGLGDVASREASGSYDDTIVEVPVVEVDCTFHDPLAGRSAARMMNPLLLTLTVLPPSSAPSTSAADPVIIWRRMELLASDMITRALLAGSRKRFDQATRVLRETKRILETKSDQLRATITPPPQRSRRDIATLAAIDGLSAAIQDVDMILDGIETNQDMFEMDYRNYAAQQTVILRTQRSWTIRTPTELHYATPDVQALIQQSGEYTPRAQ